MYCDDMPTADLFMLLASRERPRSEYSDSDDDSIVIDVSAELGKRIDAARREGVL